MRDIAWSIRWTLAALQDHEAVGSCIDGAGITASVKSVQNLIALRH